MSDFEELPSVETVIEDPASSYWLKASVQTAIQRDPVEALNDALLLAALLDQRLRDAMQLGLLS
jgi:hypothetical protein